MCRHNRVRALAVALVIAGSAGLTMAAHHEVVGRWNITVGEGNGAYPSWIKIGWEDGKHPAWFLGRAGGVDKIGNAQFNAPTVEFNAHGRKWTGTLKGDVIEGTTDDGKGHKEKFVAKRAVYHDDVSGTWTFTMGARQQNRENSITFRQAGDKIQGALARGGKVEDIEMKDGILTFTLKVGRQDRTREVKAALKGDVLEGEITNPQGQFVAKRQRQWGEPIELFNGKDLTGWKPLWDPERKNYKWSVIDGIMHCEGGSSNIVTERADFRDFKLHVEFRVPERGNSGVYLRGRHEVQIADNFGQAPSPGGCGSMYSRLVASTNASKKAGEWQTYDITLIGRYVTVIHNGTTIIDNQEIEGITGGAIDSHEGDPGPIYLQGDHSAIDYRKLTLTPAKSGS